MKLDGIHHVTCITGDAPANVEFYAGTLGLRLVKKTVNQDDPTVYHLFYADERGSAGSDITFFEYPGAPRGRAGDGMVHRIVFRVASEEALDFWAERASGERNFGSVLIHDPEGLALELVVDDSGNEPLIADHPEIPRELALRGFAGVRAYSSDYGQSAMFLWGLGFTPGWEARGEKRSGFYVYDEAPEARGMSGAGTVHHVAWSSKPEEHEAWIEKVRAAGGQPTPVIDRFYFRSIYFREPSGVLFEIATLGPGFTADEPLESLGEHLSLPPNYERMRARAREAPDPAPRSAAGAPVIFVDRPAVGSAEGALVLVHGRGASEYDLLGLLDALDPAQRLHGFCPRGPLSLPPGGAHWYAVPRVGYPDPATFAEGYAALSEFVDSLPYDKVILGGFSQGAVMSLAVGLGLGRPRPSAVIALLRLHPHGRRLGARALPRSRRSRSRTERTTP